jgi:hypothetical protein
MIRKLRGWGHVASALIVALTALMITGCGKTDPVGTVEGRVTFNDEPYSDAAVVFLSMTTGQAGTADIQAGGNFKIATPLPVGTYTVYLAPRAEAAGGEAAPVTIDQSIPQKYWNEAASDISIQVSEGENKVEVRLES